MTEGAIRIMSNIFIICGLFFFASAVALVVIRERHNRKSSHPFKTNEQSGIKQKELRQLKRANYEKNVRYSHAEPPYAEGTAEGKDLHHEGAGLMVPIHAKVKHGTKLDLELFLGNEKEPLRITGEVVWIEGLEDEKMEKLSLISEFFARRVGVKFKDVNEENARRIKIAIKGIITESNKKDA